MDYPTDISHASTTNHHQQTGAAPSLFSPCSKEHDLLQSSTDTLGASSLRSTTAAVAPYTSMQSQPSPLSGDSPAPSSQTSSPASPRTLTPPSQQQQHEATCFFPVNLTEADQIHRYCFNCQPLLSDTTASGEWPILSSRYAEVDELYPSPVCSHLAHILPPFPSPKQLHCSSPSFSSASSYSSPPPSPPPPPASPPPSPPPCPSPPPLPPSPPCPSSTTSSPPFSFLSDPSIHSAVHCCTDMTAFQLDRNLALECFFLERVTDAFAVLCSLSCRYGLLPVIVDSQLVEIVHRHIVLLDAAWCFVGEGGVSPNNGSTGGGSGTPKKHPSLFASGGSFSSFVALRPSSPPAKRKTINTTSSSTPSSSTPVAPPTPPPAAAVEPTPPPPPPPLSPVSFLTHTDLFTANCLQQDTVDLVLRAAVAQLHNLPSPTELDPARPTSTPLPDICTSNLRMVRAILSELLYQRQLYIDNFNAKTARYHDPIVTASPPTTPALGPSKSFHRISRGLSMRRGGSSHHQLSTTSVVRTGSQQMEGDGRKDGLSGRPDEGGQWHFVVRDEPTLMIRFRQCLVSARDPGMEEDGGDSKGGSVTMIWFHVEGIVEASALAVVSVLNEVDLYGKWIPYFSFPIKLGLRDSVRLHQMGRIDSIGLFKMDFPWPMQNRECLTAIWSADELEQRDYICVNICSVSPRDAYRRFGVRVPPRESNIIRILLEGSMIIRPLTTSSCSVGFLWKVNPRMHVPPFLLEFITKTFAKAAYTAFRSACQTAMSPDSAFAARRNNNPFLYAFFAQRVLDIYPACNSMPPNAQTQKGEEEKQKTKGKGKKKSGWFSGRATK
eukprot:GHVS01087946.1.p1 GENE.GHVS01087946.1~~GHVS01087946.1.p1  ORF type:complete len:834 (-),score=207.44 GHVS01087946.1:232-2733(-)